MRGPPLASTGHSTLVGALEAAAQRRGGVTFVDADEREQWLSWETILARASRAAAAYASMGVKAGDRIAIVLKTEPAFLDAFLGAWLAAAIPVPLPSPTRLGHLGQYLEAFEGMVRAVGPAVVVANGTTRRLLGQVVGRVRPPLGCRDAAALADTPARIRRPIAPHDLALLQFGWGGQAGPRPVGFTHGALAAQVAARGAGLGLGPADVLVSWLAVSHDTGLVGCLLGVLAGPSSLVLLSREAVAARPELWLRAVARHRGTVTVAPASAYGRTAAQVTEKALDRCTLETLRLAVARSEPSAPAALRAFASRFAARGFDPAALSLSWGLAEPAMAVSLSARGHPLAGLLLDGARLARDGEVRPGTREVPAVGQPLPGVEVEVRDEGGRRVLDGRLGRLWVRAPQLLGGTEAIGPNGWLDSGELGFVKDGEIHLHARCDEVVLLRGARHAPEEFEGPLAGLPGVTAAVALTMPPPQGPDGALLLLVEVAARSELEPSELGAVLRRVLLEQVGVVPHTIRLLPPGTLPRTGTGRLRRAEALRRFLSGQLAPPRRVNPMRLVLEAARSQLAFARLRLRER